TNMMITQAVLVVHKIADVLLPRFAELWTAGDREQLRNGYISAARLSMALAVGFAVVLGPMADDLISFWVGREHYAGAPVVAAVYWLTCLALGLSGQDRVNYGRIVRATVIGEAGLRGRTRLVRPLRVRHVLATSGQLPVDPAADAGSGVTVAGLNIAEAQTRG